MSSFLQGNKSKAQCGFQSRKGFADESEWYPGCCAIARVYLGACANLKQMYFVLFDMQMNAHGGM